MAAMKPMSDLVQLSKLDTQFHSDPEYTQHVKHVSHRTKNQRRTRKDERWKRERELGRGGFAIVWLERCIQGDSKGEVRAVKKIPKLQPGNYNRELEAIALFSYAKFEERFVKSFGWYDDDDSIFITMEYLPDGDLQKYLNSPLPEKEGQHIVRQMLEGLRFMHETGFAHRDLKPANILVVSKGPDWWVKIADFGISKRATEGTTVLRTQIGTPAFAAPEVLGFVQPEDGSTESYTNAVDIWSLGVVAFLILTGETLFRDQRRLGQYITGRFAFPFDILHANKVSAQGCEFVKSLMAPKCENRPGVKECLQHPWIDCLTEAIGIEKESNISESLPTSSDISDPEPSASWTTQEQITAFERHESIGVHAGITLPAPYKVTAQPISEPAVQTDWGKMRELMGHTDGVEDIAYSPDGKRIASASIDCTIRLWDSMTGAICDTFNSPKECYAVAFSPDGKRIASTSYNNNIKLWNSTTGVRYCSLKGHHDPVSSIAFSPDGKRIASASYDKTIRLWDSTTGIEHNILEGHTDLVNSVAFSPDGKQIASASSDCTIRLWDSTTGIEHNILEGHTHWVSSIAFSPDGKRIASASYDETIRLWDSTTGIEHNILKGHTALVNSIAFSPDGEQIASASGDKTVKVWDLATKTAPNTLNGHVGVVQAVTFSPNGKQIACASNDRTVKLWNMATVPVEEKAVSKDGKVKPMAIGKARVEEETDSKDEEVKHMAMGMARVEEKPVPKDGNVKLKAMGTAPVGKKAVSKSSKFFRKLFL